MSSTSYSSSSVYYNTPISSQGTLGFWVPRVVPASASDQIVQISPSYNQRPDLMAHDLYGDSRLWWVFSQRNPNSLANDPLGNFVSGLQIYIPNAANLKSALGL
jgi:hypothetical protein